MDVRRFDTVAAFYDHAAPFLLTHEAVNNVMIGFALTLRDHPERVEQPAYLATLEDSGTVIAAAMMLPPDDLLLAETDQPVAAGAMFARDLFMGGWRVGGSRGTKQVNAAFAAAWSVLTSTLPRQVYTMRLYDLTAVTPAPPVSGRMRPTTDADRPLLNDWMVGFFVDTFGDDNRDYALKLVDELLTLPNQGMMIWDDPDPVTMAGFRGRTPNGVRIGMVYTPPEYRRKGYATACVAALSQHLLDSGCRYVCLYTDLTNPTSNHIYQTIGYRPVVDSDEYGFS